MSRPIKCRKICHLPPSTRFIAEGKSETDTTLLTLDEYECIRLLDYLDFSQEDCAVHMQVSRATVQLIYEGARKKLATALVHGHCIHIDGGHFRLDFCENKKCGCHNTQP